MSAIHNTETCRWCADERARAAGIEPGIPAPPPVNNAARQALALGAVLTIVTLTVAVFVYALGSPPT